ncbi:hypothetical protein D1609_12215 [Leptospira borgpetersenii serovar Hardjo-bovis]|nr:hypothetical protein B9T54_12275 [Leptospira borgpetersenii serovar Hardjo-bovis]AYR09113.1 hypothetical protein D1609_12215 [Leptospira borgpetersenii serovar Hardjo-bovis]TQE53996.1 hypothetical protein FFZ95_05465 [Leptospira borgpetersenii]TQE58243.1 hypothetical protein FFZ96_04420 [Leptospira borgpetersenii]
MQRTSYSVATKPLLQRIVLRRALSRKKIGSFFTSKKSKLSLFSFSEFIPIGKIWNPKTSNLPGI